MSERLSRDREGKYVQMTLGRRTRLGNLLLIWKVCPLLLGVWCILQHHLWLRFFVWWGLCHPEVSLISVLNLILDFIHSEIVKIEIIPLFWHLYFLQVLLAPSEKTITLMVYPIIMIMMFRVSAMSNAGIRWALEMMRLRVKTPILSQCPPLPVGFHSFYSLLILNIMVAKVLARRLVLGFWWLDWWMELVCFILSLQSSGRLMGQAWWGGHNNLVLFFDFLGVWTFFLWLIFFALLFPLHYETICQFFSYPFLFFAFSFPFYGGRGLLVIG